MHFDLVDMRMLVAVVEAGSMAEAARRANVSVSALHERMKLLESRAGTPLLERNVRGSRPTPAGLTMVQHARVLLHQAERLIGTVEGWKKRESGTIKLRVNSSALASFLPRVLASFLARHPDVTVDLHEETSVAIASALRSGATDIGIVAGNVDLQGLHARPLLTDRLVVIAPSAHRLAGRRNVEFADVLGENFIGLDEQSAIHAYLDHQACRIGRELTTRIRLRSFEGVCRLVAAGAGVSIVPESILDDGFGVAMVPLVNSWARRDLIACTLEGGESPRLVELLLAALMESDGGPSGEPTPRS